MGEPPFIPKKLAAHGLRVAHPHPLVSNGKGTGSYSCSAPGSLDTSLSHAAGLIEIAACHA